MKKFFMMSGKLLQDPSPLEKYLGLSDKEHQEEILPSSDDLKLVDKLIKRNITSVTQLIEYLSDRKIQNVNRDIARKAVARAWKIHMNEEDAAKEIAKELSEWILEIAEGLGKITIKYKDG